MLNMITAAASTVAAFEIVIGIMTTNACTCCRSVFARLISWPVCTSSWKAKCRRWRWAKIRSRRTASDQRASRNANHRLSPLQMPATTPATRIASDHLSRALLLPSPMPRSMATATRAGTATLAAVQARPAMTPAVRPFHWCPSWVRMRRQPARLAATSFSGASFCDLVSTASWLVDPHLTDGSG